MNWWRITSVLLDSSMVILNGNLLMGCKLVGVHIISRHRLHLANTEANQALQLEVIIAIRRYIPVSIHDLDIWNININIFGSWYIHSILYYKGNILWNPRHVLGRGCSCRLWPCHSMSKVALLQTSPNWLHPTETIWRKECEPRSKPLCSC